MDEESVERHVALTGSEAVEWLVRREWEVVSSATPFHLFADEVRGQDFLVRRQWMSTSTVLWAPLRAGVQQVTMIVEGEGTVETGDRSAPVSSGAVLHRAGPDPLTSRGSAPFAFMQIESTSLAPVASPDASTPELPIAARPALVSMLSGQISSFLNSEIDPGMQEFAFVKTSMEYAAMALLLGRDAAKNMPGTSAERELYRRAVSVITSRATDRELTLDGIARSLSVSKPYLQRAFRRAGTTPLAFLQERRAIIARDLLEGRRITSSEEYDSIARLAGFSSARTMRAAMRGSPRPSGKP